MTERNKQDGSPLAKELSGLSHFSHPLDPEHLAACSGLLNAIQGSQPAKPVELLITKAGQIVRSSIGELSDPEDRFIAEAIFGLGDYAGLKVPSRIELLDADKGISENVYWKRRRRIVQAVAFHASQASVYLDGASAHNPPEADSLPEWVVTFLASRAARLHFKALAAVFIARYERESGTLTDGRLPRSLFECSEELFHAYLDHMAAPYDLHWGLFMDEYLLMGPYRSDDALRPVLANPEVTKVIPKRAHPKLAEAYGCLCNIPPYSDAEHIDLMRAIVSSRDRSRTAISAAIPAESYANWSRWMIDSASESTTWPLAEALAVFSERVLSIGSRYVELASPVRREAQQDAIKWVALTQGLDEWRPTLRGKSLRFRMERHFENAPLRLPKLK